MLYWFYFKIYHIAQIGHAVAEREKKRRPLKISNDKLFQNHIQSYRMEDNHRRRT